MTDKSIPPEAEWVKRCAARYKKVTGMTNEEAAQAAQATFEEEKNSGFENGPEEAADNDMECWEP